MLNIESDILSYVSQIKYALNNREFLTFKNSLMPLKTSEIIYEFRHYDSKEISYAIAEIRKKYPVYDDTDLLCLYIKSEFNHEFLNYELDKQELEYLLEFLESDPSIDVSIYESLLKVNYNLKYKDRIDKLLRRKVRNVNKNNNELNKLSDDFLFKTILSSFNIKFDYLYSFDKDKYFSNMYHSNLICEYLINLGYSNLVEEINDCLKDSDFNRLYKTVSKIKLSKEDIENIKNLNKLEYDNNLFDIRDVSLLEFGDDNLDDFISSEKMDSNAFCQAIRQIEAVFKGDLKDAKSFEDIFKDTKSLYTILYKIKDIYKTIGLNIDISYIYKNIKDSNFDINFIKELYILKGLYNLVLYAKLNNINLKKITSAEDFLNLLKTDTIKKDKNLAFKYNSSKLKEEDILPILLILFGNKNLKTLPKKEQIDIEINDIKKIRLETKKEAAKELYKSTNDQNRYEKYTKYFEDLNKIEGLSQTEKELEMYNQANYFFRQRYILLLMLGSWQDDSLYNQLLGYLSGKLRKELYDSVNYIKEENDELISEFKENPQTNYKEAVVKVISDYEKDIETYNKIIESLQNNMKNYTEYKDDFQDKIDQIDDMIKEIRDKQKDILNEFCERKVKDMKFENLSNNEIKQLEIDLDDFVIIDRKMPMSKESKAEAIKPLNIKL